MKDWHSVKLLHLPHQTKKRSYLYSSRKELPLLPRRRRVTFQGMSSRNFHIQQGVYIISMNGKLQVRSSETITNSLNDLLSAQDFCKHQSTSAKIKPTSHHLFPHTIQVIYIRFLWKCIPCFLSLLSREIRDKRTTAHMENRTQCPDAKYTPLQNQHHTGPEKVTNLSLKRKKN